MGRIILKGSDVSDSQVLDICKEIDLNDTSSLIYTSGTTGNPKGVELTYKNWSFSITQALDIMKFNQVNCIFLGCLERTFLASY